MPPDLGPFGTGREERGGVTSDLNFLIKTVVEARRGWAQAQQELDDAQIRYAYYGILLVQEMEKVGATSAHYDGVVFHRSDDGREEWWENDPIEELDAASTKRTRGA